MQFAECVGNVRKRDYFAEYGESARVLEALLDKYADSGLVNVDNGQVLELRPINRFGTKVQIIREIIGGKDAHWYAIEELERELYRA